MFVFYGEELERAKEKNIQYARLSASFFLMVAPLQAFGVRAAAAVHIVRRLPYERATAVV